MQNSSSPCLPLSLFFLFIILLLFTMSLSPCAVNAVRNYFRREWRISDVVNGRDRPFVHRILKKVFWFHFFLSRIIDWLLVWIFSFSFNKKMNNEVIALVMDFVYGIVSNFSNCFLILFLFHFFFLFTSRRWKFHKGICRHMFLIKKYRKCNYGSKLLLLCRSL